jgi:hypothetical protein
MVKLVNPAPAETHLIDSLGTDVRCSIIRSFSDISGSATLPSQADLILKSPAGIPQNFGSQQV